VGARAGAAGQRSSLAAGHRLLCGVGARVILSAARWRAQPRCTPSAPRARAAAGRHVRQARRFVNFWRVAQDPWRGSDGVRRCWQSIGGPALGRCAPAMPGAACGAGVEAGSACTACTARHPEHIIYQWLQGTLAASGITAAAGHGPGRCSLELVGPRWGGARLPCREQLAGPASRRALHALHAPLAIQSTSSISGSRAHWPPVASPRLLAMDPADTAWTAGSRELAALCLQPPCMNRSACLHIYLQPPSLHLNRSACLHSLHVSGHA
jgi:hypothetical protein